MKEDMEKIKKEKRPSTVKRKFKRGWKRSTVNHKLAWKRSRKGDPAQKIDGGVTK